MPPSQPLPERRPLRLPDYDYASPGPYFVTLVIQDRLHLLGEVIDKEMHRNPAGEMVIRWWNELSNKFPNVYPGCHAVMPNHFHGVLEISAPVDEPPVGADLCVGPLCVGPLCVGPSVPPAAGGPLPGRTPGLRSKHGAPLPEVMQWFKTMTTNEYIRGVKSFGWRRFNGKFWQRSYYEHIVREDRSYEWIMKYIEDNPIRWDVDEENR